LVARAVPGLKGNGTPYPLGYQGRAAFPTKMYDPHIDLIVVGSTYKREREREREIAALRSR